MNSNEKTFNYKVLNLAKYYNFGIGFISIILEMVQKIQKIKSQKI
jgi:hypothetical protein